MATTIIVPCPLCRGHFGGRCQKLSTDKDAGRFNCDACGEFLVSNSLLASWLGQPAGPLGKMAQLTPLQRAALAHWVKTASADGPPMVKSEWFARFLEGSALPTPSVQADNIVRFVGDAVIRTGEPIEELPLSLAPAIGAPSTEFARRLAKELADSGVLHALNASNITETQLYDVNLTLRGWQHYEAGRRGKVAGNYGFVAFRFGNALLDRLLKETVKPGLRESLGFDLVDMRDVATAGVIDNIMRAQIRDAAFILADLTDDNPGAYWEAGYAEGLGKPVIYLCEAAKFTETRTHFDTNHCTTVMWTLNDADHFMAELVATLRRSLNLFPSS